MGRRAGRRPGRGETRVASLEVASLIDALKSRTCPACYAESRAAFRYLDTLFYEHVNDPGTRARLAASLGFCRMHAQQVRMFMDPLGIAIVYEDLLGQAISRLVRMREEWSRRTTRPQPGRRRQAGGGRWAPWRGRRGDAGATGPSGDGAPCPACEVGRRAASDLLRVLVQTTCEGDPEVLRALPESRYGVCFPHLLQALQAAGTRQPPHRFLEWQLEAYRRLQSQAREFIDLHDYRRANEPMPAQVGESWTCALEACNGGPAVLQGEDIRWPRLNTGAPPAPLPQGSSGPRRPPATSPR